MSATLNAETITKIRATVCFVIQNLGELCCNLDDALHIIEGGMLHQDSEEAVTVCVIESEDTVIAAKDNLERIAQMLETSKGGAS